MVNRRRRRHTHPRQAYDDLMGLLALVSRGPWSQADLIIDRSAGEREVVVYAQDDPDLTWEQVAYRTRVHPIGSRGGSDQEAVIGAARVLAALAGDVVRVGRWPASRVMVYHIPLDPAAYEAPLIGVGLARRREGFE
ncbi:hypothetical protein [Streptomyces yaizuensis]|uniref:Uncharacterized protein n=1 Tax=Streptomyces yaizuensis TaxID=2989713 RepID=A0AA86MCQ7_9ACTN|nr:hypothetical protein [Streptomyces sp. YSPA8]BDT39577.1 hypothetical protein SYYSPA8_37295 [Streptomyces sp. YSPA8]